METGVLENILNFSNGKAIKPGGNGKFKAYGANGVIGGSDETNHEDAIILGRVGAYCGAVEICNKKFWASDNTIVVYPKEDNFNKRYTYYLLIYLDLNKYAGGAAQPLLTQTTLKKVAVSYHDDESIRNEIAEVLYAYDNLIENNNRRIAILEEMAQSLYREWFVKFRFPGYENTKFIGTKFGKIPEGWVVTELGSVIDFWNGKKTEKADNGEYVLYGANGVIGRSQEYTYENAIIIGRVGAYCGAVEYCFDRFWGSDNTIIAKLKNNRHISYLFLLLKNLDLNIFAGGAAQPLLTQTTLKRIGVVLPLIQYIEKFSIFANDYFYLVEILKQKTDVLKNQRDSLIPKLLSGAIKLNSNPHIAEEA